MLQVGFDQENSSSEQLQFELKRRECIKSLSAFVRFVWSTIDPGELIWNWHMEVICDHLQLLYQGDITNLAITIPPSHSKSLLSSVLFPAWIWLQNPSYRLLCASRERGLTVRDSVRCRDLIQSDLYRRLIRNEWGTKVDQCEKSYYVNTKKGYRYSLSVNGGTTGWRGDMRIVDDPSDANEVKLTLRSLQDVIRWWDGAMSTRLDPRSGRSLIIMQRLHDNDLVGHVLREHDGDYTLLSLPTEYDPTNDTSNGFFTDPRKEEGELLFPQFFDGAAVKKTKRTLGSYHFAAQHQQRPTPREGGIIEHKWINYYTEIPDLSLFNKIIAFWDCAVEDHRTSSYVVGALWGSITINSIIKYYLLDLMRDHANIVDNIRMIRSFLRRHPKTHEVVIEKKANGAPILQLFDKKFAMLVPYEPVGSKEARLRSVAPEFEAGNVLLPLGAEWLSCYIEELTQFPNHTNDDQVDCTSGALIHLQADEDRPKFHFTIG